MMAADRDADDFDADDSDDDHNDDDNDHDDDTDANCFFAGCRLHPGESWQYSNAQIFGSFKKQSRR